MTVLNLNTSNEIAKNAFQHATEVGAAPLTVAVLDQGGKLIALQRQDGSSMLRPDVAIGKAWGALALGKSSREIGLDAENRPAFISALNTLAQGNLVPVPGGVLVMSEAGGEVLGAVGISGDTSDIDELCAIEGIRAAGLRCNA
ncbi:GlcG/HbpS family heme-binding protein [Marinobacterium jannaschii]|uniref:GlcG/HbpS family heme-binding protein n=1 Tax=Marinobacterium jannaschii TaxID=64970 RepID=UPI0004895645|nr:heme-binding protein [Marinobacterium jannaschii]